jgi:hypothetical protein
MGLNLRKLGGKIFDQLNVLDNGKTYQNQQGNGQNQSVLQQAGAIGKGIVRSPVQLANTTRALGTGLGGLTKLGVSSIFGTDQGYQDTLRGVNQSLNQDLSPNSGLLGQGTFFKNRQEAQSITPRQLAGKSIAQGTQIASLVAPELKIGEVPALLTRPIGNAVLGAAGSAGGQYIDSGKISPKVTLKNAATAAALGEAVPLAKSAVGIAAKAPAALKVADNKAFTPRASLKDQEILSAYKEHLNGTNTLGGKAASDLITNARQVGDKHGINLTTGAPKERIHEADRVLTQLGIEQRNAAQGGYLQLPGSGESPTPPKVSLKDTKPSVRGGVKLVGKGSGKLDSITGMHDILNSGGTVDEALNHYMTAQNATLGEAQLALKDVLGSKSLNKSSINAKLNPEHGSIKLGAVEKGNHIQPILNSRAIEASTVERGNKALSAIKNLSANDHALLDDLRTTSVTDLAKRAENPETFTRAAEATKSFNDFTQASAAKLGQDVPYRQNYGAPLLFEQTPEEIAAANKAFLKEHPGYGKSRTFKDYNEAAQYGLVRRHSNFGQDVAFDVSRRSNDLKQLALARGLEEAYPGQVKIGEIGATPEGTYKQLQIAGGNKISLPAEIADEINRRASGPQARGALKAYDTANAGLKYVKLGGGTFHGVTEAGNIAGQQLTSGNLIKHPVENLRLAADTFSPALHKAKMAQYAGDAANYADGVSTLDRARLFGATLEQNSILGDIKSPALSKIPVIHQIHEAIFTRQIPEAKLMVIKQMTKDLDVTNPADVARGRDIARAMNKIGGINRAVDGLTPQMAKKVSRVVLATDFTEGRWRTISSALSQGGAEGKIARQMVVGKTLVFLLPTLAAATAAGKIDWNDPNDVAKKIGEQIIDPHFPTGFKTPAGYDKIAKTPETFISEIGRMVKPIFDNSGDKTAGVKHYFGARLAAAPSTIEQAATNQDYFGNPIIARDTSGKVDLKKSAANIGINSAPIPVSQGIKVAQGKQTSGEAVINTLGLRTVADKNDPNYQKTQAYFRNRDKFVKGLPPAEQALFNKINPEKKDQYGNAIEIPKNTLTSPSNYGDLLANQKFADKYQAYKASEKSHDPLWDLPKDQLRAYMQAQVISKNDPGGDSTTVSALYKRLPADFFTKREQYFGDLKDKGVDLGSSDYKPKPSMPDNLVAFSENYHKLPYGTGERSKALRSPEGQAYIAYLDQNRIYNNQERADLGLPPLEDESNKYSSSGQRQRNSNPYQFAVSLKAGGSPTVGKGSSRKVSPKSKSRSKVTRSKPKVTIKRAMA